MASLSYKTVQLLEAGAHDPKLSTLQRVAKSLGYPPEIIDRAIAFIFEQPSDSVAIISERILLEGENSWKIWLFEFVDAFRKYKDPKYISAPPVQNLSVRITALIASVVETLCEELELNIPMWCCSALPLKEPWFVSGVENLKASAIMESPLHFRKRNIFVLENFLSRR